MIIVLLDKLALIYHDHRYMSIIFENGGGASVPGNTSGRAVQQAIGMRTHVRDVLNISRNGVRSLSRSAGHYPQAEVLYESIEVSITMEQGIAALNTSSGDHRIDCLADRHPQLAQGAKIPCCLYYNFQAP